MIQFNGNAKNSLHAPLSVPPPPPPNPNPLNYLCCRGDFGRLGHGDIIDVFLPKPIAGLSGIGVKKLACGDTHTLAVTAGGALFSFGRNQNGQLGVGTDKDALSPVPIEALKVVLLSEDPSRGSGHCDAKLIVKGVGER